MIKLKEDNECEVCGKCVLNCPTKAISFEIGKYGNYAPVINREKCRECHICEKVCGSKKKDDSKNYLENKHYIGYIDDKEIRDRSSSGGIFSAAALWVLSQQGIVIGAAYDEETLQVRHIAVSNETDLQRLRKSKYVQSDWIDSCEAVRKAIKDGRWILFSGTPCQVQTAKETFGNYSKIFFMDLFCHGVAMAGMFREYMRIMNLEGRITSIDFRHKQVDDTSNFTMCMKKADEVKAEPWESNVFCSLYIESANMKRACFSCSHAEEHMSDITIGDFCDWWDYDYALQNEISYPLASFFSINTEKGEQLFSLIKEKLIYREMKDTKIISSYYRKHEDRHGSWGYNEKIWDRFQLLRQRKDFATATIELLYQDELKLLQEIEKIKSDRDELLIYGAGIVGRRLLFVIRSMRKEWRIKCYLVSENGKTKYIDDIPVVPLREMKVDEKNNIIVVAVSPQNRESVLCELRKNGIVRFV